MTDTVRLTAAQLLSLRILPWLDSGEADGFYIRAHKDRAARLWCENATQLTTQRWKYPEVPQAGFNRLQPTSFANLLVFEQAT
jgi:hypothetical protein